MNCKTIAAIAQTNADFPTLRAKLEDAAAWVEHAAGNGALGEITAHPDLCAGRATGCLFHGSHLASDGTLLHASAGNLIRHPLGLTLHLH